MPRRKATPLDEMMPLKQQPRSRLSSSSMIQTSGQGLYAGGQGLYAGGQGLYAGSQGHGLYAGGNGLYAGSGLAHKSLTGQRLIGY